MIDTLVQEFQGSSWLELVAVIFAIAYLILAVRENILCWYAAFISTSIFLVIFWQVNLYMESGLQVYYLAMAIYGWYEWTGCGTKHAGIAITTWSTKTHVFVLITVIAATIISGQFLHKYSDARLPYLDSFTTWASVVTTYMVAKKVLENWLYWLVIDSVAIYLYLDRELYFTALLFLAYIVIVIFGFYMWLQEYRKTANQLE